MPVTIFQKAALWVNDYSAFPKEVAGPLYDAGWRVIVCQAQDHGDIAIERIADWRAIGYRVGLAIRPSGAPLYSSGVNWSPAEVAEYTSSQVHRLNGAAIVHFDFEDEVEAQDEQSGGLWSQAFCKRWRELRPGMASVVNTYFGARGMNLEAYTPRAGTFRLSIQTYDGNTNWTDPPTSFVNWLSARGISPGWAKPCFGVHEVDGKRVEPWRMVNDASAAGTVGMTAYPADSAPPEYLAELIQLARAKAIVRL